MRCPKCKGATAVVNTKSTHIPGQVTRYVPLNVLVRRRACYQCRHRFISVELAEAELDRIAKTGIIVPQDIPQLRPEGAQR